LKKLMNDPNAFAAEALEGLAQAYPQYVRKIEGLTAVTRKEAPIAGKVAVLTGGGSGHEPMFAGFVGPGWADASVVLFLYGNYAGDVLNFDTAAEMLAEDGIQVSTVRICDDVASAPPERRDERRGIAGDFFVIKVACARAEERAGLTAVTSAAKKANDHLRSMGVALTSCVIPASGRPIFALSDQEMEIGGSGSV